MSKTRNAERKPLSFSTTMRNPDRIAGFLNCLLPYENMVLTTEIINEIIKKVLKNKLYKTMYQLKTPHLKDIYFDSDKFYTEVDIKTIIENSPQNHKEAGFKHGWDSRFDTWYKLPMELGFTYYEMNKPIKISNTGHMLIDSYNEQSVNERKIQNVMLNALMKYQTNNPFRKNLNSNSPLLLLLNVLKLLKEDKKENGAGLSRQELSILICWNDDNAKDVYEYIKTLRKNFGFNYSDEFIYERCLDLLGANVSQKNRFKMNQICGEAVDEYIRKMRSTGIISLRGNGRFIDFNMLEENKIRYVIENYSKYPIFTDKILYYDYMGTIDNRVLDIKQSTKFDLQNVKQQTLYKYAEKYTEEKIFEELVKVCSKKESKDSILKFINAPTRLEFLTSISLVQQFKNLVVSPNYSVDDEGLPVFTASGGLADIECFDSEYNSYFEVTLMCGRQDQVNNEIVPIRRHLKSALKQNPLSFSVFVAPVVHEDTIEVANLYKIRENLDILTFNIKEFIEQIKQKRSVVELLDSCR